MQPLFSDLILLLLCIGRQSKEIDKISEQDKTESDSEGERDRERAVSGAVVMCRLRCCRDQRAGTVQQKSDDRPN